MFDTCVPPACALPTDPYFLVTLTIPLRGILVHAPSGALLADLPFGAVSWDDSFWALATDALPPQDAVALGEDLGVERDSDEHAALERGSLCALPARGGRRR